MIEIYDLRSFNFSIQRTTKLKAADVTSNPEQWLDNIFYLNLLTYSYKCGTLSNKIYKYKLQYAWPVNFDWLSDFFTPDVKCLYVHTYVLGKHFYNTTHLTLWAFDCSFRNKYKPNKIQWHTLKANLRGIKSNTESLFQFKRAFKNL